MHATMNGTEQIDPPQIVEREHKPRLRAGFVGGLRELVITDPPGHVAVATPARIASWVMLIGFCTTNWPESYTQCHFWVADVLNGNIVPVLASALR